ncbi:MULTISPECIES: hypothetical protein [unclassified Paenibacillus]|uniref:DUF2759 domain-containing protein n=1 Tax=Paenibacillus provencensis TaxID=441151 RepID=A0ABW3PXX1_9BACL|nr:MULTISPECIES: hypothetical protein [unclassified Paenibacillus]MCM3129811.1 hypothetical protein [Paenibacillus sp. MER 78]SFS91796.1 hypothetical protein SAMN04488601_107103 [Paenibacillus sp. 453mf]
MAQFIESLYGVAYFAIVLVLVAVTILTFVTGIKFIRDKKHIGFGIGCIVFSLIFTGIFISVIDFITS